MFRNEVQPSTISLFSSTGTQPLGLWCVEVDPGLPKDSHITLVADSSSVHAKSDLDDGDLDYILLDEDEAQSMTISHPVLHIQSPTLASTFIRCPSSPSTTLDIGLPWLHFQVRNLRKPWSFEVGIRGASGRDGVIRCSTFQVGGTFTYTMRYYWLNAVLNVPQSEAELIPASPSILLVPLKFPAPPSSSTYAAALTSWSTISVDLRQLTAHFGASSLVRARTSDENSGSTPGQVLAPLFPIRFESVAYIKIYATCRLRRVWLTEDKEKPGVRRPWELELYG